MALEIERKFLVLSDAFKNEASHKIRISQGYLSADPERTVRIRIKGDAGFITIKGLGNESGTTRYEWEKEIPLGEAIELIKICKPGAIDKTRYFIKSDNHTFEVDEFYGDNAGLVVAEIELTSEDEAFQRPDWLGDEVTGDVRYYNSVLMKTPYKDW
jgi:adenylate cyclase